MITVQITWVEIGTRNSACLGIDETIEITDRSEIDSVHQAAIESAYADGVDLDRFECLVEVLKD